MNKTEFDFSYPYSFKKVLQIIILLCGFVILEYYFSFFFYEQAINYTNGKAYFSKFIFLENFNKSGFLITSLLITLPFLILFKRFHWAKAEVPYLRTIVFLFALILSWILTTYQYNYLFDQWHLIDRLFLLGNMLLILIHPIFIVLFLIEAYTILAQFNYGPGIIAKVFYDPVFFLLILTVTYFYIRSFITIQGESFLITFLAIQTSNYFSTGVTKSLLGEHPLEWALTAKIYLGNSSIQFIGYKFTNLLSSSSIDFLFQILRTYNRPIVIGIFFLEIIVPFLLVHKVVTLFLLYSCVLFHILTYFSLGVSFWPWIFVNVILIFWILILPQALEKKLYGLSNTILLYLCASFLVVVGIPASNIGWWSVRSHYAFDFAVENKAGQRFEVDKSIFAPMHRQLNFMFSQDYLIDQSFLPTLVYDYSNAKHINNNLKTTKDFKKLKKTHSKWLYDAQRAKNFDALVKTFLQNYNRRPQMRFNLPGTITANFHAPIVDFPYSNPQNSNLSEISGRIVKFHIRFREGFFNGSKNITVNERTVRTIKIPY